MVLGLTARLTISALQVAGSVIAQQLGLGFVTAVDPTQGQQGLLVGNFLTLLGVTLIFATDLHHLIIAGLNDSYRLFQPGEVPVAADVATLVTNTVGGAFRAVIAPPCACAIACAMASPSPAPLRVAFSPR